MKLSLARFDERSLSVGRRSSGTAWWGIVFLSMTLAASAAWAGQAGQAGQAAAANPQAKRAPLELLQNAHALFLQKDYEAARGYYLEVLPSFPKNIDVLKNLAFCFYRRGPKGYAAAATYYSRALELSPDSLDIAESLARCLTGLKRNAEAGAIYEKLAKRPNAPPIAWKQAAEAYANGDRYRQAESAYDAYLQRNPGDLSARTRLGDLYTHEKNYPRAQEQYRLVLSSNPNYSTALIGMGRLSSWQGQHEEALKYFDRALRLSPNNGEALTARAFTLLWSDRPEEARALFQKLQKRYPRSGEISRGLDLSDGELRQRELLAARRAGDTARIEAYYRDRLTVNANDTSALKALAEVTGTPERCSESISLSRRGLEISPNDQGLESRLTRALVLCQQYAEAITHYNRILESDPNSEGALTGLGSTLLRARRNPEAIDAFRKALQINPQNSDAKLGLALALAGNHNYDEALPQYNEVLKTSPNSYDALQGKAFVLLWTDHREESRAIFQSLAALRPADTQNSEALTIIASADEEAKWVGLRPASGAPAQDWVAFYDRRLAAYPDDDLASKGRAYNLAQLSDTPAAIAAYRKVLEKGPDDVGAKRELARLLARDRQYEESIRLYREVLAASPDDADSMEGLAREYVWNNQDRDALALYQKLIAASPANTGLQMEAARLQLGLGDNAGARQSLNTVIAAEPQNREALVQLAKLDLMQGDREGALKKYDEVLKKDPKDTAALLGKAQITYYQGDAKQAYAAANDVVAAEPNNFDAVLLLASIEHARGHRRQTKKFLGRAEQISPNNPEVVAMRQRLREERAVTIHTSASYSREIGPATEETLGAIPVSYIGISTDAAGRPVVNKQGVPVPRVVQTALPKITATGLPNEDVRFEAYGVTIGVPLSSKVDSYFSFTSLPTQSPTPSIQGAVAPWTFVSRLSWHPSRYLTVRGGAGLTRFGPADIQRSPDLTGDLPNLVDRFGSFVTNALGITPTTVPGEGFKPVGLAGATIAPSKKFSIDLDWMHGPAVYYPTPRAMKLHVTQTRFDGTLNFNFTPRTELHFNMFYTRLFTDSSMETATYSFMDSSLLANAFTPYTAVVEVETAQGPKLETREVNVPVPEPMFQPTFGQFFLPPLYLSGLPIWFYPSSGIASCPVVTLDFVNNITVQPTRVTPVVGGGMFCAMGQVVTQTSRAADWGHGGSITFNQNIVRSDRFSLDGGYRGNAYGFAGRRRNVFLGFFNPAFYQNEQLTGRIYGRLFGPVGYDWFSAIGIQQTDHDGALTRAYLVKPSFSFKVSPNLTIGIAYTHYNTAQVLGPLSGNSVSLTTDWKLF